MINVCCFVCSWTIPYSLPEVPILGFNVNITSEKITLLHTNSTELSYCPSDFGTYNISVAGLNDGGEGLTDSTQITLPSSKSLYK